MAKTCCTCKERKVLSDFNRHRGRKDGLSDFCRACNRANMRAWREKNLERKRQMDRDYAAANRERAKQKTRDWTAANPQRKRQNDKAYAETNKARLSLQSAIYRDENRERILESKRKYAAENKERIRAEQKAWKTANRGKVLANVALRKARKKRATLPWLTKEHIRQMRDIYETAEILRTNLGQDFHVDHICPISHPLCCGLHVPWNLQILPAAENIAKSNRIEGLKGYAIGIARVDGAVNGR